MEQLAAVAPRSGRAADLVRPVGGRDPGGVDGGCAASVPAAPCLGPASGGPPLPVRASGLADGGGTGLSLGPGDYAVHAICPGAEMVLTLPDGSGQGLALFLDPAALSETALDLLAGTGLTGAHLREKFCRDRDASSFAGNEETGRLFRGFYDQPSHLKGAYQKLKTAELLLYLWRMEDPPGRDLSRYSADQIATIRAMHDSLTDHLDQRVTIEALARQYLMNQTTLKRVFKAVYGNSLAAHIKEHRMEQAAKYLLETERSIAEIAQAVGYDSQSRFSKAFQETFSLLPTEFRRSHRER